jgi:hypothetical protein
LIVVYYLLVYFRFYKIPTNDYSYPLCDVADRGKNGCRTRKY